MQDVLILPQTTTYGTATVSGVTSLITGLDHEAPRQAGQTISIFQLYQYYNHHIKQREPEPEDCKLMVLERLLVGLSDVSSQSPPHGQHEQVDGGDRCAAAALIAFMA
eukprot:1284575-Rhodomonas_salina.1